MKDRRPALDQLVSDARRRKFDVLVCWRLDRLGRNLKHLVTLIEELQTLGVAFVSLGEGIDCTTPAGKLQLHILAALAEFERGRLRERVLAGLERARSEGKRLGRPRAVIPVDALRRVEGLTVDVAAARLQVSRSTIKRWRRPSRTSSGGAAWSICAASIFFRSIWSWSSSASLNCSPAPPSSSSTCPLAPRGGASRPSYR